MMNYALIGKKLGHSFSADFFNEKFRREGISSHYSLVELSDFDQLLPYLRNHPDIVGLNVTIPYKEDAYRACQILTPVAQSIGAVNTIKVTHTPDNDILLSGTNTDAPGFAKAVGAELNGRKRALVFGTGGASKAVTYALSKAGIAVTLVSRQLRSYDNSVSHDSELHNVPVVTYDMLTQKVIEDNTIIVNTTPLGMYPNVNECPPIPYEYITPAHFCFDAVYNPKVTLFMKKCHEQGAEIMNGLDMLFNQAILAWDFWQQ